MYNNIVTQLLAIAGGITTVKATFDGYPGELVTTPAVWVLPSGEHGDYLDTLQTKRQVTVKLTVANIIKSGTMLTDQQQVHTIVDSLITALWSSANTTLGGNIAFPVSIDVEYPEAQVVPADSMYRAVITYVCQAKISR